MDDMDFGDTFQPKAISLALSSGKRTLDSGSSYCGSTTAGGRRGRKEVQKICLVPECDEMKKPNSKWCRHHSCHADNCKYAASKKSEEQKQAVLDGFKDDNKATEMILAWQEKNIASGLFKNGVVDWAEWNSKFGLRVSIVDTSRKKPYEKLEFIIRQKNKFGRSDEEAKNMWNEAEAGSWKRDYKGYRGQLRLWLPKGEFQDRKREQYIDEGAVEGSNRKKGAKEADRDAMRQHVNELATSHGHEFFAGRSSLASGSERMRWEHAPTDRDLEDELEEACPIPHGGPHERRLLKRRNARKPRQTWRTVRVCVCVRCVRCQFALCNA